MIDPHDCKKAVSHTEVKIDCRHKERPQRPFTVWSFDVSKQIISMLVAQICGEHSEIANWTVSFGQPHLSGTLKGKDSIKVLRTCNQYSEFLKPESDCDTSDQPSTSAFGWLISTFYRLLFIVWSWHALLCFDCLQVCWLPPSWQQLEAGKFRNVPGESFCLMFSLSVYCLPE